MCIRDSLGTLVFLCGIYGAQAVASAAAGGLPFWGATMNMGDIATLHTFFNIGCTVLLLPFHKVLVRLVERTVPGDDDHEFAVLDERFLATPAVGLDRAHDAVVHMGSLARDNYRAAVELLSGYDPKKLELLQAVSYTHLGYVSQVCERHRRVRQDPPVVDRP